MPKLEASHGIGEGIIKDESLDNLDDLPPPDVLQQEIIEHLEAALNSFRDVAAGLAR